MRQRNNRRGDGGLAALGNRGTAAVELALISPMLLILFAGVIDFGRVYHDEIELSSAVAAAGQYALLNAANINSAGAASLAGTISGIVSNGNGVGWASASVTVNAGPTSVVAGGVTTPGGTAANADSCWCPTGGPSGGPTGGPTGGTTAWSWGTAATCGATCAGGTLAGKFVTIAGTRSFTAIFGNYGLISNTTLHQSAIVQSQ
jgi:hypothetical protein